MFPCPSCGSRLCDHVACYFETPAPADEETTSTLTMAELREMYPEMLTENRGDPFLKANRRAA
jgi:hypothetical protein